MIHQQHIMWLSTAHATG